MKWGDRDLVSGLWTIHSSESKSGDWMWMILSEEVTEV